MTEKSYHQNDLRNKLIETGIQLIDQDGLKTFSIRKVAALCGVSHAAPYSHFRNKEELLIAMQDHVIEQLMDKLKSTSESVKNQKDPEILVRMGKSYVTYFVKNPQYFAFLFSQQPFIYVNLSIESDGSKNFPPFELLKMTVFRVFGENGVTEERMEDIIITLWAMVHGLASIVTMKNVHYDKAWETKINDFIRIK